MRWSLTLAVLFLTAVAGLQEAEPCDEELCKLPNCRCSSTNIPGGLAPRDTPQFVLLTFDDGVNVVNINTYRTLYNRRNRNGCPAGISFYVTHEFTNYALVNELYNRGYEIALHSITHQTPQTYWMEANYTTMLREFGDQILQMEHFANIPRNDIHGVRLPFLQMAGNASFQMMSTVGLTYDISWPTASHVDPGLWPYTLDYATTQDCLIPPCPTASIPGVWVIPMITWSDLENVPCSFVDSCFFRPDLEDEEGWFQFMLRNFERHYRGNRAPFGFYVHEWFISSNPAVGKAFHRFLDLINNLHDTFMVNAKDVIEWVRNPVPVDEYVGRSCNNRSPTSCFMRSCGPLNAQHTTMQYWMQVCSPCPNVYPWVGNPLGT